MVTTNADSLETFVLTAQGLEEELASLTAPSDAPARAVCLLKLADMAFTVAETREQLSRRDDFRAMFAASDLTEHHRKLAEAAARLEEAERLYGTLGDLGGQAECRARLGFYLRAQGQAEAAHASLGRACQLAERAGKELVQANCLLALGELSSQRGDADDALARLRAAAALYEQVQPGSLTHGQALLSLARTAMSTDHPLESARKDAERALAIFRALEHMPAVADSLWTLGVVLLNMGDAHGARVLVEQALPMHEGVNDSGGCAACQHVLGWIALREGDQALARQHLTQALALFRRTGDAFRIGEVHRELARLASDWGTRAQHAREAEAAWSTLGDFELLVELRTEFGLGAVHPTS